MKRRTESDVMKTMRALFSAWFLVLGGAVLILFSPWMMFRVHAINGTVAGISDTGLICRMLPFMVLGIVAMFLGTQLREMARR